MLSATNAQSSNDTSVTLSSVYAVMLSRHLHALTSTEKNSVLQTTNALPSDYLERQTGLQELSQLSQKLAEVTGDYGFGLQVGTNIHPSDYGIIGYALMNAASLKEALRLARQYKQVVNRGLHARIVEHGEYCHYYVENTYQLEVMQPMVELDFSSAIQFSRLLAGPHRGKRMKFEAVHFQHSALTDKELYQNCFDCPVYFNQPHNLIIIKTQLLDTSVYGANAGLFNLLQEQLQSMPDRPTQQDSLKDRVHQYLALHLGQELPCVSSIASHFNMSASTFKKHLNTEGSHYQKLWDNVRREEACKLLDSQSLTVKQIAYRLGFTSTSAFSRAFKRWVNIGPREYKQKRSLLAPAANQA